MELSAAVLARPIDNVHRDLRAIQFFSWSTSLLALIHGIIARSWAPVCSIGCAAAALRAALSSGWPARLSSTVSTNRPEVMSARCASSRPCLGRDNAGLRYAAVLGGAQDRIAHAGVPPRRAGRRSAYSWRHSKAIPARSRLDQRLEPGLIRWVMLPHSTACSPTGRSRTLPQLVSMTRAAAACRWHRRGRCRAALPLASGGSRSGTARRRPSGTRRTVCPGPLGAIMITSTSRRPDQPEVDVEPCANASAAPGSVARRSFSQIAAWCRRGRGS